MSARFVASAPSSAAHCSRANDADSDSDARRVLSAWRARAPPPPATARHDDEQRCGRRATGALAANTSLRRLALSFGVEWPAVARCLRDNVSLCELDAPHVAARRDRRYDERPDGAAARAQLGVQRLLENDVRIEARPEDERQLERKAAHVARRERRVALEQALHAELRARRRAVGPLVVAPIAPSARRHAPARARGFFFSR